MMPEFDYFDAHSHIHDPRFTGDLPEVLSRMRKEKVGTLTVGTDLATSRQAVALAEANEGIWSVIGLHPTDTPTEAFDEEAFGELLSKHKKVVAVGECGLDYFHQKEEGDRARQRAVFEQQLSFAKQHRLPVMLHIRDAYEDALSILKNHPEVRGNVHFFAGSRAIAERFLDIGFTLSFTGVVTFARDYDEVIREIPLSSILTETDCPYVAPVPHRGKRNEPIFVREVAQKIAEIRGDDGRIVAETTTKNAIRVFRLPFAV